MARGVIAGIAGGCTIARTTCGDVTGGGSGMTLGAVGICNKIPHFNKNNGPEYKFECRMGGVKKKLSISCLGLVRELFGLM
jgi:hypothetical protein